MPELWQYQKPKVISYFPPKIVKCLDCNKKNLEKEFFKKDSKRLRKIMKEVLKDKEFKKILSERKKKLIINPKLEKEILYSTEQIKK